MKNFVTISTVIVLCSAHFTFADSEKDQGKKVPPGLAKKGGVPPGQAKKQDNAGDPAATVANTPATPTAAPAPAPAPAAATIVERPAATAQPTATALKAAPKPAPAPAKPATFAEQKAKLDAHAHAINKVASASPALQKVALQQVAKETGLPLTQVQAQHKSHPEANPISLLIANLISKKTGAKFNDLMEARDEGKHWAEIAKARGVEIDPLIQKSYHLTEALQTAQAAR